MNLERIINTDIEFIDGDRGQNYPSKSDFFENGYCVFLNTGNITRNGFDFSKLDFITEEKDKSLRKGKVKSDDIILTTRGTVGNVALVTETIKYANMRINSGMVIIRSKKDFTPLFLNAFFRSELFKKQALTNGSGSAQPQLPISALKNISIPKLDKKTQDKITSVLSALDEKIALNNETNATLEQMAKTLYDYWFVQFDFPDENGKPYKTSGGEMVYNETLKRDIPKGWESSNILKVADLLGGGTPRKDNPDFWNGNIPFFTPTDCDNSVFVLKTSDNITDLGLSKSSTKLFKENTIFITARGSVGRMSLNAVPMAMNQSCYALQPKEKSDYSYLFFLTKELVHNLEVKAVGSVFDSIVSNDIEQTFLAIPPNETIKLFVEKAEPIFQKIKLTSSENNQLTKLRDWLLPMLMNGQVTVQ